MLDIHLLLRKMLRISSNMFAVFATKKVHSANLEKNCPLKKTVDVLSLSHGNVNVAEPFAKSLKTGQVCVLVKLLSLKRIRFLWESKGTPPTKTTPSHTPKKNGKPALFSRDYEAHHDFLEIP